MIQADKKLKDLTSLLNTKNYTLINEAISMLRDEKPFEGVIGLITSFYNKTDNFPIRKTIEEFLNDLKEPSVRVEIINEISKKWHADTISMLVSSCWQSGMDYSEYTPELTKVFLKGDYLTAVECLTVIVESVNKLNTIKKNEIIQILKESPLSQTNEKKALTSELLVILEK